jgi:3-methyl-2-oxobutanoate hydroxymethyltransferase
MAESEIKGITIDKEEYKKVYKTFAHKGRKHPGYLQKCKDDGVKLVQFCPNAGYAYFTMAAEMAGLDICRLTPYNKSSAFVTLQENMDGAIYTIRNHREKAPNMHINFVAENIACITKEDAYRNGCQYIAAGADTLLIMGISNDMVKHLADNYVPTFCHIGIISGWQTQGVGGYHRVGRTAEEAMAVFKWGYEYQENGMTAMTIEMTPMEVSAAIAKKLRVPVISIAGGAACDGSEMVDADLFGVNPNPASHAVSYANFFDWATTVYSKWADDVRGGAYPEDKHGWHMDPAELDKFMSAMDKI